MHLKYLVTGTGRCGTVYAARLLTSLGVPCGHEAIFKADGLDRAKLRLCGNLSPELSFCSKNKRNSDGTWLPTETWLYGQLVGDSSYMAAAYLDMPELATVKVAHLVRHPDRVVRSFVGSLRYFSSHTPTNEYERYIYAVLPELTSVMTVWDRAALYWVLWTEMIDRLRPDCQLVKIEQTPTAFIEWLGTDKTESIYDDVFVNSFHQAIPAFHPDQIESNEIRSRYISRCDHYQYRTSEDFFL